MIGFPDLNAKPNRRMNPSVWPRLERSKCSMCLFKTAGSCACMQPRQAPKVAKEPGSRDASRIQIAYMHVSPLPLTSFPPRATRHVPSSREHVPRGDISNVHALSTPPMYYSPPALASHRACSGNTAPGTGLEQQIQAAAARERAEQRAQTATGGTTTPILVVAALLGRVVTLLRRVVAGTLLLGRVEASLVRRWRLLLVVSHARARRVPGVVRVPAERLLLLLLLLVVRGLRHHRAGASLVRGRIVVLARHCASGGVRARGCSDERSGIVAWGAEKLGSWRGLRELDRMGRRAVVDVRVDG